MTHPTNSLHRNIMTTTDTAIIEIEAPAFLDDPKVLAFLEGTDANISRLVLEDGKLWAYSKRAPDSLCKASLIDMVALAFPKYAEPAPAVLVPSLAAAEPCAPAAPLKARKAKRGPLDSFGIPKTGEARGLLADFKAGKTGSAPPRVFIRGTLDRCPPPILDGTTARIAVAQSRNLIGYALLDQRAFEMLRQSSYRPDSYLFNLVDGVATTRVRRSVSDPYVQSVDALLAELGSAARVRLKLTA